MSGITVKSQIGSLVLEQRPVIPLILDILFSFQTRILPVAPAYQSDDNEVFGCLAPECADMTQYPIRKCPAIFP